MNKIIVVLGMHRSGTSAITRGLKVLGAEFGPELMPAQAGDNEKGFWEDLAIYRLNERVLEKLGSSWDAWSDVSIGEAELALLEEEKKAALELLTLRTENHKIYAFKDPRTSVLLPFWQAVFGELQNAIVHYLLAIRTPKSVASSLQKRNEFPLLKSYVLWLKYNFHVLRDLYQTPIIVDYDLLMAESEQQLLRLAEGFGIEPSEISKDELDEYVQDFLSDDLRHSQYDLKLAPELNELPLSGELYTYLYGFSNDTTPNFSDSGRLLESIANYFDEMSSTYDYLDVTEAKLNWSRNQNDTMESEIKQLKESLEEALAQRQEDYDKLNEKIEKESQQKESLEEALAQFKVDNEKLKAELEFANKEANVVGEKLKQFYSRLHIFDRSLLGRFHALTERVYALLKFKPRSRSYQAQLIEEANAYLGEHNINPLGYASPHGRFRLAMKVMMYALRHPFSSLRLLSFYRLKKLFKTVMSNDRAIANSWVNERFPESTPSKQLTLIVENESLDSLKLNFPKVRNPRVSVVVPVFNEYRTTISCLQSVLVNSGGVDYEVIIGDDASSDITRNIESRIHNIKIVRAKNNQGFLKNCNDAVRKAKGDYVVLLNNDTNAQPGWLQPLLTVIENRSDVGLVGPKLLFADGKLQEAGGIIWKDGSGWNFGRGQDANKPEFSYLRETDYISGACIMFRKKDWDALKGFDETFCPAYYEDTDLAFQMRQKGLKVIYQPESEVVHFEGVSNGTDLSSGVKKHQAINQKKFTEKWRDVLEKEHFPNAENVFQARERSTGKRTVVFIDHYVPFYDKDAGSRSTWLYVKAMVEAGINVKFLPANFYPHQPYTSDLQQLGVEVLYGEYYARNWKKWFKENASYIDVIYLHRPHITEDFIDSLTALTPKPKLIYFGHDLHYLRTQREAELHEDTSLIHQADDWKKREFQIFEKVDKVFYPSSVEEDEIKQGCPHVNVSSIPLYLLEKPNPADYQHQLREGILFVGGFGHPPNEDAVIWFVEKILPQVLAKQPDIEFHVVGSKVPDSVKKLADKNVVIHGFVSDEELADLYWQVRLVVVPLRFGAGVKGKVLEALQAGVPILTTSIGAEGLPEADSVMKIEDLADTFAKSLLNLYTNEARCLSYIKRYPDYINKYFSDKAVRKVIDENFLN